MATRSYVGIAEKDDQGKDYVDYIYCHWDGYLTGVGKTLLEHYDSYILARSLINLGDVSCIGSLLPIDGVVASSSDVTVSYASIGEENTEYKTCFLEDVNTPSEVLMKEGILYLFVNGEWNYFCVDGENGQVKELLKGHSLKTTEYDIKDLFLKKSEMSNDAIRSRLINFLQTSAENTKAYGEGASDILTGFQNNPNSTRFSYDNENFYSIPGARVFVSFDVVDELQTRVFKLIFVDDGFVLGDPIFIKSEYEYDSWGETDLEGGLNMLKVVYPKAVVNLVYTEGKDFDLGDSGWRCSKKDVSFLDRQDFDFICLPKHRNKEFAKELSFLGLTNDSKEEMNKEMYNDIMRISDLVSVQGHSGFSFSYLSSIMSKFFSNNSLLSPLTGDSSEWVDVTENCMIDGKRIFQNKRLYSVFKEVSINGTAYCYWIDGKVLYTIEEDENGQKYKNYFTNSSCHVKIDSFPWVPPEVIYEEVKS